MVDRGEAARRRARRTLLGLALAGAAVLAARPAPADAATLTAFLQGASPSSRLGQGYAFATPLVTEVVSAELEYARSREETASPSLTTLSASVLLVAPFELLRFRPYFVTGIGLYRQRLGEAQETSVATAEGVGVFFRLGGPLHLRADYRVIQLSGQPLEEGQKRFYAGASLRF